MIPKCSNLVQGITLGYTRSDMLLGLKVKGQGHMVNKSILHTGIAIYRHSPGGVTVTGCLGLRGCLVRPSLTFARWRNQ